MGECRCFDSASSPGRLPGRERRNSESRELQLNRGAFREVIDLGVFRWSGRVARPTMGHEFLDYRVGLGKAQACT
jgi:hypothetical protein